MSEHFTLDELAELDAGVLPRRRADAARRHLAECDECSAKADALHKTQERLGDLGPVPMPADVVARLERALADAGTTGGEDVVPDLSAHSARRGRGVPAWAYLAAAAVVVIGGTAIALGTHHHTTPTVADTAAGAPIVATESPATPLVLQESGRTYTPTTLPDLAPGLANGDQSAVEFSATTPEFAAGTAPQAGSAAGGSSSGQVPARKTTNNPRGPAASVAPAPALAAPRAGSIAPSLRRLANSRSALLKCAAFITDTPGAAPIAVDFGRWTNAKAGIRHIPSVVFVFNDTDDPNSIDVFVVAAACDDSSLLDFQVVDRRH